MRNHIALAALAASLMTGGCSGDKDDQAAKPAIDDRTHPEMRVDAPLRPAYAKLYSCRFQTEMMNGGPQKPPAGYGDRIAAEIKADPKAGDKCLRALSDRQGLAPAPSAPAQPKSL